MRFKIEDSRKQIARLHKLLKRFPKQPAPEDVHRLRGLIRTLEAIVDALTSGRERKVRHLLALGLKRTTLNSKLRKPGIARSDYA